MSAVDLKIPCTAQDLESFTRGEVWRSENGEDGPWLPLTVSTPQRAVLPGSRANAPVAATGDGRQYNVSGSTLSFAGRDGVRRTAVLTGVDPLTARQVVTQINAQTGLVAVVTDAGEVAVSSIEAGQAQTLEVLDLQGNADLLGFTVGELRHGVDQYIQLYEGLIPYRDLWGSIEFRYKVRFRNHLNNTVSEFGDVIDPNTPVRPLDIVPVTGFLDVMDSGGAPQKNVRVTCQAIGYQHQNVAVVRHPLVGMTDQNGRVIFSLLPGMTYRVGVSTTAIWHNFRVPDDPSQVFNILDPLHAIAQDNVGAVVFPRPAAPRRTLG